MLKKIAVSLILFSLAFIFGCKSTPKTDSNFTIGDGADIGFVKDWSNPEFEGGKTTDIVADGLAMVDARGIVEARDRSIEDAKRKAVEQAVGTMMSSEKVIENNRLIKSEIYSKTSGYIASYKIIDERQTDKSYYVKISANVGVDMIEDNLMAMGVLIDTMNLPLIVVLVTDEYGNISDSFNVALERHMSLKGFQFVDNETLKDVLAKEKIKLEELAGSKSVEIMSKIGLSTGAQVAVIGKADANFFKKIEGTAMKSYRSNVAIRVVSIADARTIAQSTHQVGGIGGSDEDAAAIALQKSADSVGKDISKQITDKWQDIVQQGYEYSLLIVGLDDFNLQIEFENKLKEHIAGLKQVYNRGFVGDTSKFMIKYIGSSRDLAVDINNKASDMGFIIDIKTFDDKTITITVEPIVSESGQRDII